MLVAFPDAPRAFQVGLVRVFFDEIRHMQGYRAHLERLGFAVGDFPVRDWFWERLGAVPSLVSFVAAMGVGNRACRIGHSTLFIKGTKLFRNLNTARADGTWEKALRKLLAPDLLIIDDFGLSAMTMPQAEEFYEIIAERHQRGSIIITSNRPPGDWLSLFPDQVMANSAMDRLAHRAHHIAMKGESFRKKTRPQKPSAD